MISFIAVHNVVSNMPEPTRDLVITISLWGVAVCVIALIALTYFKIRLGYVHRVSVAGLHMIWMLYIKSRVHAFNLSYSFGQLLKLYPEIVTILYKKFWVWDVRELAADKEMFDYIKNTLSSEEKDFIISCIKAKIDDIYTAVNKYYNIGEEAIVVLAEKINKEVKSDDALKYTQAALNLAHVLSVKNQIVQK